MDGGGHTMAAGCSFEIARLSEVESALEAHAHEILTPDDFIAAYQADLEIRPGDLTLSVMESISMLEPYGESNPEPFLIARSLDLAQINPTKNPAHVQVTLRGEDATTVSAVGFSMGERFAQTRVGNKIDVLFQPKLDDFRGRRVKWQLKDFSEV
ncbi:MAG: hypothetical protein BGO01_14605 [Armatimonadetes bacterium 55-13]|nr:MAG: hypothetical protein BGO01_14605 [Armatimonadetes bacterium 55-13]